MTTTANRRHFALRLAGLASAAAWPAAHGLAQAQGPTWPERPVRVLHGFAAGGNADVVARLVATELARQLGQPFIVDPKPGAGGTLAADTVAKAKPDGYTMLVATGGHAIAAAMYDKLPYDTQKSFQPISALTSFPFLVVVNQASKFNSLQDLLAAGRNKAAPLNFGSAGIGTGQHLTGGLLAQRAGLATTHVPYRGDAASVTALLGGEVDFVVAPATAVVQHVRGGKLRALAISGSSRWSGLPNVPTVAEQGVANFDVRSWTALLAPAGTPRALVDRLNAAVRAALADEAIRRKLEEVTGGDVRASTPEELAATIDGDVRRWVQLVREANIQKE